MQLCNLTLRLSACMLIFLVARFVSYCLQAFTHELALKRAGWISVMCTATALGSKVPTHVEDSSGVKTMCCTPKSRAQPAVGRRAASQFHGT